VTIADLVALAKAVRGFDAVTLDALEHALAETADMARLTGLRRVVEWLHDVEGCSGNDEELADDVGGALSYLRTAISRMEGSK